MLSACLLSWAVPISTRYPASAEAKTIAYVGLLTEGVAPIVFPKAFETSYDLPSYRLERSQKVVVLKKESDYVAILLPSGHKGSISKDSVLIGSKVTLKDAIAKIKYFERLAVQEPWNQSYYDSQLAPWVALVARQLGLKSSGKLPDLNAIPEEGLSAPKLEVKNKTSYSIRLYLTGPETFTRVIEPNGTLLLEAKVGGYDVLAEVTRGNVLPLKTVWTLRTGYSHGITLYIRTVKR